MLPQSTRRPRCGPCCPTPPTGVSSTPRCRRAHLRNCSCCSRAIAANAPNTKPATPWSCSTKSGALTLADRLRDRQTKWVVDEINSVKCAPARGFGETINTTWGLSVANWGETLSLFALLGFAKGKTSTRSCKPSCTRGTYTSRPAEESSSYSTSGGGRDQILSSIASQHMLFVTHSMWIGCGNGAEGTPSSLCHLFLGVTTQTRRYGTSKVDEGQTGSQAMPCQLVLRFLQGILHVDHISLDFSSTPSSSSQNTKQPASPWSCLASGAL